MLRPRNPKIHGNVPCFCPDKILFILTLHTHRQSLDWPLISILTSQPIHKVCSGPWKTSHMFSIYKKTVNCKTSWKVSFGSYRGLLQILIDIGPMSSTFHAVNGRFVFRPQKCQIQICIYIQCTYHICTASFRRLTNRNVSQKYIINIIEYIP